MYLCISTLLQLEFETRERDRRAKDVTDSKKRLKVWAHSVPSALIRFPLVNTVAHRSLDLQDTKAELKACEAEFAKSQERLTEARVALSKAQGAAEQLQSALEAKLVEIKQLTQSSKAQVCAVWDLGWGFYQKAVMSRALKSLLYSDGITAQGEEVPGAEAHRY